MGDPANKREDDDDSATEAPRVSGTYPLAVVVSPEEAAELERLEPAARPKYKMLVVYPSETIDVLKAVEEVVTIPVAADSVEAADTEVFPVTHNRRQRRRLKRQAAWKADLDTWSKQRKEALQRKAYRNRLLELFFLRELLPLSVLTYTERYAGRPLRTVILPRTPFSAINRLVDFSIHPQGHATDQAIKRGAMRFLQERFIRLQVRSGFKKTDESVPFFHNLERGCGFAAFTLSDEAEEVFLAFRRTLQRTDPDKLYRSVLRRGQTREFRDRVVASLIERASAQQEILTPLRRWLHFTGGEQEFVAVREALGDISGLDCTHPFSGTELPKLEADLRLDFLISDKRKVRKFMRIIRQGYP